MEAREGPPRVAGVALAMVPTATRASGAAKTRPDTTPRCWDRVLDARPIHQWISARLCSFAPIEKHYVP